MGKSKIADMISKKDETDYTRNVAINIRYEMDVKQMTIKDVSTKTGIAESTLRLRLNNPDSFKLQEIAKICKVLRVPPYKIASQKLIYTEEVS